MKATFHFSFIIVLFSLMEEAHAQGELVSLRTVSSTFNYEIRYATQNNFIGKVLYECEECLLQKEVADALVEANQYFCELGFRIKIYDCYRPLDVQKTMWAEMPNPTYVANPYEGGSVHNRGAAVDLTLETLDGCYVDMGSDYDYFGLEAHIDHTNFPREVLNHRKILLDGMRLFGFHPVRTEWWHFWHVNNYSYPIMNTPLPCNN